MKDILINLKTLFFSYMSVIVLLLFAIAQSDQESYDLALNQLNEIEKRASSYNSDNLHSKISQAAKLSLKVIQQDAIIEDIQLDIKFSYLENNADYSVINERLQKKVPNGYNFGIGNRTINHPEFTKVSAFQSLFIPVGSPLSLDEYKALHNGSLQPIHLPVFSPDLSRARLELFQYKTNTYNSIELVNTTEYKNVKVLDNLALNKTSIVDNTSKSSCRLESVITNINKRYAFMCSIANIEVDSVKYSGARILVPAKKTIAQIPKNELLNILNTPQNDQRPYERAFQELADISKPYANLSFDKIEEIIRAEKSRNPSKLSVFGAEINVPLLTKLVVPLLILICLYISLHLREAVYRANQPNQSSYKEVPWIALYRGAVNEYVLLAQLLLLPLVLVATIHFKSHEGNQHMFTWIMFLLLVAVNIANFIYLRKLRQRLSAEVV